MKYPVAAVFGNDYRSVSSAAKEHLFVCKETKVGKTFSTFARKLAKAPDVQDGFTMGFLKGLGAKTTLQPST